VLHKKFRVLDHSRRASTNISTLASVIHNTAMANLNAPIEYEYDFRPQAGEAVEILPGIKWLNLPLPFLLSHINTWLLDDEDGWAAVDTGVHTGVTRQLWDDVIHQYLEGRPISRVLVTHLHPDHVGCAGWLCDRFDVDLYMTRDEYLLCRILVTDTGLPAPEEGRSFYCSAGFSAEQMERYIDRFGAFGRVVSELPQSYRRLQEGRIVNIGPNQWQVITGRGHSPEHACLFCPELNVLISGDQVLPTISPNVSVWPTEPAANPLAGWFKSLHHLKDLLPEDVLVLPSHGKPFRGVKSRLDVLIDEHETCLDKLRDICGEPRRALDVFPALFKSKITDSNLIMATGEAFAHLNYLFYEGEISIDTDDQGVRWYQTG